MSSSYVPEEPVSPEDVSRSIEPALKPMPRDTSEPREFNQTDLVWTRHHG
jgi:hypothetical protein